MTYIYQIIGLMDNSIELGVPIKVASECISS